MANCQTCKWSDETIKSVLTCFHPKHPLSRCSKKENDCADFENEIADEPAKVEW